MIVSDTGTELTSNAILKRCAETKIEWHCIAPGKPMRDAFLDETLLRNLGHARDLIAARVTDCNTARPPSALGYQTPRRLRPAPDHRNRLIGVNDHRAPVAVG